LARSLSLVPTAAEHFRQQLVRIGPVQALAWLDAVARNEEADPARPPELSWMTVADGVEHLVWHVDRAWARFAVRLLERFDTLPGAPARHRQTNPETGQHYASDLGPPTWIRKAMQMRCRLIEEGGPRTGDEVLDPAVVFDWVRDGLTLDLAEAVRLASTPTDRADVAIVYFIRQRLVLSDAMTATPGVTIPNDLRDWYRQVDLLRPQAPLA